MSNMANNDYHKMGREIIAQQGGSMPGSDTSPMPPADQRRHDDLDGAMMTFEDAYIALHGSMDAGGGDADYGAAYQKMIENNAGGWENAPMAESIMQIDPTATEEDDMAWQSATPEARMMALEELASGAPTNLAGALAHHENVPDPAMMEQEKQFMLDQQRQ